MWHRNWAILSVPNYISFKCQVNVSHSKFNILVGVMDMVLKMSGSTFRGKSEPFRNCVSYLSKILMYTCCRC